MKRYIITDTWQGGEIVHESNQHPWLNPLRSRPRNKSSKRRRSRTDPVLHLMTVTALLGALVMFLTVNNLYSR